MRVIAGALGGRNFLSPRGHKTHPMSDKIRGALFNTIGDISGLTVLDAFAGSGALSFEALSRGAKSVTAIDSDQTAYETIVGNAKDLNLKDNIKIIRANCASWSKNNPGSLFDIVIVDPPYYGLHRNDNHVFKMFDHVKPRGLFILSYPPRNQMLDYYLVNQDKLEEIIRKDYGDAQLVFCRRLS